MSESTLRVVELINAVKPMFWETMNDLYIKFINEVDHERDLSDEEVKYYLKKFQGDYSSMICT